SLTVEAHRPRGSDGVEDAGHELAAPSTVDLLDERITCGPWNLDRPVARRDRDLAASNRRRRRVQVGVFPAAALELLAVRGVEPSQQVLRRRLVLEVVAGEPAPDGRGAVAARLV